MKLNQFESSISFIHNNLPGYIRSIYEKFITLENELYSQIKVAFESNPYSVNEYLKNIIYSGNPQFLEICKYIMSEENQLYIQQLLLNFNEGTSVRFTYTEEEKNDYGLSHGDIVAPLEVIKCFVSSFPHSIKNSKLPIICIEPTQSGRSRNEIDSNPLDNAAKGNTIFWDFSQYDELGNIQLFDNVYSTLKIDIDHVLTFIFYSLLALTVKQSFTANKEIVYWEGYETFHNKINSEDDVEFNNERESILSQYIKHVEGSAILTYMSYAGRLIGAKENLINWLYSTFVKDTVNDIEQGEYLKNVDITSYSGHQTRDDRYRESYHDNFINRDQNDREKTLQKNIPSGQTTWNTNLIYRNLRLNYSNWCTVINAIVGFGNKYKGKYYFIDTFFDSKEQNIDKHLKMAQDILEEFISHYYATYNVYIYPTPDKSSFNDAGYFIKFVSARIFNQEIKDIIAFTCINVFDVRCRCLPGRGSNHPHSIPEYFLESGDVLGILSSISLAKNFLADLFMTYSYIIMLTGLFNSQSTIMDEEDPLTGKSKKSLFNEIYLGLVNKIKLFFEFDNKCYLFKDIVVYNGTEITYDQWKNGIYSSYNDKLTEIFTPLERYKCRYNMPVKNDISILRNILKHYKNLLTIDTSKEIGKAKDICVDDILIDLYDIHPISVIADLARKYPGDLKYQSDPIINATSDSTYTRAGSVFPRNRVSNDLVNNVKIYNPKLFTSLESAQDMIEKAKEDSILGNNANYSFIGGIGGSVTEEEIEKDELPSDNSVSFNATENYQNGIRNIKVDNLVNSWVQLFKQKVLRGKDIMLPDA